MDTYKPTTLYIKFHALTGLLYFGKTVSKNVDSYFGSGKRWLNHLRVHGKEHVITLWHETFNVEEELIAYALDFSELNDIANSPSWANLIPERGTGGSKLGAKRSEETRAKMKAAWKNRAPFSDAARLKMSLAKKGKAFCTGHTEETKQKMSAARAGVKRGPYKSKAR